MWLLWVTLSVLIALLVVLIAYWFFYLRPKGASIWSIFGEEWNPMHKKPTRKPTQAYNQPSAEDPVLARVKPMYRPQHIGQPTGEYRLFQTNKGQLRLYPVNEQGLPLPAGAIQATTAVGS